MSYDFLFCANRDCKRKANCARSAKHLTRDFPHPFGFTDYGSDNPEECKRFFAIKKEKDKK